MIRLRTLWLYAILWAGGNAASFLLEWSDLRGTICGVTSVFVFVALIHFNSIFPLDD